MNLKIAEKHNGASLPTDPSNSGPQRFRGLPASEIDGQLLLVFLEYRQEATTLRRRMFCEHYWGRLSPLCIMHVHFERIEPGMAIVTYTIHSLTQNTRRGQIRHLLSARVKRGA